MFQTSISNDVALALDYVLSMQYFRIFRYTSSSQSHLVDFAVSRKRLAGDKHIDDYLGGLLGAASCFSPAEKQALHAMLRLPLQLAMDVGGDAEQSWLQSVYEQVQSEYNLSAWCGRLSANAGGEFWTASDQHILKAWLYAKLDSEETRAAVGHQSLDRLRQFSETDRLVKSLVATAVCTPAETCAPLPTSGVYAMLRAHCLLDSRIFLHMISSIVCLLACLDLAGLSCIVCISRPWAQKAFHQPNTIACSVVDLR